MELAGIVAEVGPNCGGDWKVGDRVAGLVAGGSYAAYCLVEAPLAMRVPPQMSLKLAASLPEAWLTAYQLLFAVGLVQQGERVLVHAGAR
jgi:NADPH:quinone reductase-like Zn-dependent oxidoreductase